MKLLIKNLIWKMVNYHYQSSKKDVLIVTTRRSGSTWLTSIINSQKKFKYVDQPLDLDMADKKQRKLLPYQKYSKFVCLGKEKKRQVLDYFNLIFEGKINIQNPWNVLEEDFSFITSS